jgi:hypothetical protein
VEEDLVERRLLEPLPALRLDDLLELVLLSHRRNFTTEYTERITP